MNLIEMTEDASWNISVYVNPDIGDWVAAIDPILEAAGECCIGRDSVESISLTSAGVHIVSSFTSRSCPMSNEMYLPRVILEVKDPIKAANIYRVTNKINEIQDELRYSRNRITTYENKLAKFVAELDAIEKS
jgi:hypothetical protein